MLRLSLFVCSLALSLAVNAEDNAGVNAMNQQLNPKQRQFIQRILPAIRSANHKVAQQRQQFIQLREHWKNIQFLSRGNKRWLINLAKSYDIEKTNLKSKAFWKKLDLRVNTLPASLILAQAINESAWGRSRFAKQGLNYFGQWCYTPGCGLVPHQRAQGASHEVQRFDSIQDSVDSYLQNINVNQAYTELRQLRYENSSHVKKTSYQLLPGLVNYSSRGERYIESLKKIIQRYHLTAIDKH